MSDTDVDATKLAEWGIFSERWDNDCGAHFGKVVVFIDDGERPGPSNIAADFAWRRNHKAPLKVEEIIALIEPILKREKINILRGDYNRKAGCSMCPCSPGYVLYDFPKGKRETKPWRKLVISLARKDYIKYLEEKKAAKEAEKATEAGKPIERQYL